MTREELVNHIETLRGFAPSTSMVCKWLEDIRDNGITEPKKYTVKVINTDRSLFLNQIIGDETFGFDNKFETPYVRTEFTQAEIEEFKKRDDLAIDWDKAIIKPVEEQE